METATESTQQLLSDDQLHELSPPLALLVRELQDIAARDPSPNVAAIAHALVLYFRTPDAL